MFRYTLAIMLLLHGGIHLIGFLKAFNLYHASQITAIITKPMGILWLAASALFIIVAVLSLLRNDWWIVALPALILSQLLIVLYWKDTRAGTILNVIFFIAALIAYSNWRFDQAVEKHAHFPMEHHRTIKN